ncbi:MAG: hypothetical protein IPN17_38735 [Deltaproteobacteria bacterium]|nr:hypothetical protein [Deltaproteobacteria bacterium]
MFGLVDRDFAMPSRAGDAVMRTERHEIENHLLDFDALARLRHGKTAAEIGEIAREKAVRVQAWMAVRRTLLEMKQDLPGFPPDPKVSDVPDASTARQWLSALAYPKSLERKINKAWTKTDLLDKRLPHLEQQCSSEIASGKWVEFFSGKEIFRHLRSVVPWRFQFDNEEDLAFKVAERWQRQGTTPTFINTLRDAVLAGSVL